MKTKYFIFLIFIILSVGFLSIYSCESSILDSKSYQKLIKEETGKNHRYDSIVHGIRLGMTYEDFYYYVFKENRAGLFLPSRGGSMVKIDIDKGFDYPVQFDFFPQKIEGKAKPLKEYKAYISYKDFSTYNKQMSLNSLVDQTLRFFEKGYEGNKFYKIPNDEDIFVRYNYVKIDGNRKILIKPSSAMNQLYILFEDLKPLKKNKK